MKRIIVTVVLWSLVIAWMAGIFYMSHQSKIVSSNISKGIAEKVYENIDLTPERFEDKNDDWLIAHYNILVRKAAHIFQYIVLGALLILAVKRHFTKKYVIFLLSWGIGILYAASDEFHQTFIPGRSGSLTDVLLDSAGVLVGCGIIMITVLIFNKIKKRKTT